MRDSLLWRFGQKVYKYNLCEKHIIKQKSFFKGIHQNQSQTMDADYYNPLHLDSAMRCRAVVYIQFP